jgi:hypothetical protein
MKTAAWRKFSAARNQYREMVEKLQRQLPELRALQQELVNRRNGPEYVVETPVVYNSALDDVKPGDEIKLILVADNPGRREQAADNRRYLTGPSGKIAEKFFRDHPELHINFRKNVIILNKTPVHTPRTADLRELCRLGNRAETPPGGAKRPGFLPKLAESQEYMARLLLEFHRIFAPVPVWITGYSEMKRGGIFEVYTKTLGDLYGPESPKPAPAARSGELFFFRHFSMNQFTIDLHQQAVPGEPLPESLNRIGRAYRRRVLGW